MSEAAASGVRLRTAGTAVRRFVRGRDAAVAYALVVVVVAVTLQVLPQGVADRVVESSSTNLVNLRVHPPFVLVVSAFVEPGVTGLLLVVPLVWALGALQRRIGRAPVLIATVLGHVGATLLVATLLLGGIVHGRIALTEATVPDVGVSYGLLGVLGLLTVWAPPQRRRALVAAGSAALVVVLLVDRSFTDLGHLVAWLIGLSLALLVRRGVEAARASSGVRTRECTPQDGDDPPEDGVTSAWVSGRRRPPS